MNGCNAARYVGDTEGEETVKIGRAYQNPDGGAYSASFTPNVRKLNHCIHRERLPERFGVHVALIVHDGSGPADAKEVDCLKVICERTKSNEHDPAERGQKERTKCTDGVPCSGKRFIEVCYHYIDGAKLKTVTRCRMPAKVCADGGGGGSRWRGEDEEAELEEPTCEGQEGNGYV